MKTIKTILIMLSMANLLSCGGSGSAGPSSESKEVSENVTTMTGEDGESTMFDSDTELSTAISTLKLKRMLIVDSEDNQITGNIVAMNSKFSILYDGVTNYQLKDGRTYPGLSLNVSDESGQNIISEADLFASYTEGFPEVDASVLRATVTVGDPMKPGKYSCSVQITDKHATNSFIVSTWSFVVE